MDIRKCAQCGGDLERQPMKKVWLCPYCGARYEEEDQEETTEPKEENPTQISQEQNKPSQEAGCIKDSTGKGLKVLLINGSPRKESNTQIALDEMYLEELEGRLADIGAEALVEAINEIAGKKNAVKAIFNLDGRLNVQTAPELEAAISGAPDGVINYDIDLAKVPYVSSAGLRVFVAADKRAVSLGGIMRLLHPCDEVMDVFDMTGFADVLKIER